LLKRKLSVSFPSIFSLNTTSLNFSNQSLVVSLANQALKTFFAAPVAINGTPSFRAIVSTDLPDLSGTYVTLSGNQTISGTKTFSSSPVVPFGTNFNHAAALAQVTNIAFDTVYSFVIPSIHFMIEVDFTGNLSYKIIADNVITTYGASFSFSIQDINLTDSEFVIECDQPLFVINKGSIPVFGFSLSPSTPSSSTYGRMHLMRLNDYEAVVTLPTAWSSLTQLVALNLFFPKYK